MSGLAEEFRSRILKSDADGGVWLKDVAIGRSLHVQTMNTLYLVEHRGDGWYISGNFNFCPRPTPVKIAGSTFGGSALKIGWVGRGMHMEFYVDGFPTLTTSEIQEVTELPHRPDPDSPCGKPGHRSTMHGKTIGPGDTVSCETCVQEAAGAVKPCNCGADVCIGPNNLLSGFGCVRRAGLDAMMQVAGTKEAAGDGFEEWWKPWTKGTGPTQAVKMAARAAWTACAERSNR